MGMPRVLEHLWLGMALSNVQHRAVMFNGYHLDRKLLEISEFVHWLMPSLLAVIRLLVV